MPCLAFTSRYNEDYGWIAGTVLGTARGLYGEVLHTMRFDVDGPDAASEDVPLSFDNGMRRWRPLK